MRELIVPGKLQRGDTIALISISGGRAGDEDMLPRYKIGKKRLEDLFGLNVIETPNALKGSSFLYEYPEKRAEDLMWALKDPLIKGIICNMGGDDSYRVLPYIDIDVIRDNPKVFMGYSDIATWMTVFAYAGVRGYYGPNVLTPIAQPGSLDSYTEDAIRRTLFSSEIIGEIKPSKKTTPIEWENVDPSMIKWEDNDGFKVSQGKGKVQGRIFSVCGGPLRQIMGTKFYPKPDFWEDTFIAIEHGTKLCYNDIFASLHQLRGFAASGAFDKAAGIITGKLDDESREVLYKVINKEVRRPDMVILENVDFVHHTPMTVLPMGAMCEIDCEKETFTILESGVK